MSGEESRDQGKGKGGYKESEKEVVRIKDRKNWMKSKVLKDYAFFFLFLTKRKTNRSWQNGTN